MCKRPVQGTNVDWLKFREAYREGMFSDVHGFSGFKNVLPSLLFHEAIYSYSELYCWSSSKKRYSEINSMELFPSSEANRSSGSHEVPRIVGNWKVRYCIHKSLPPIPILSHIYPICASPPHFLKIHLSSNLCLCLPGFLHHVSPKQCMHLSSTP